MCRVRGEGGMVTCRVCKAAAVIVTIKAERI